MYKRIYDKTNKEIDKIKFELKELNKQKQDNEKEIPKNHSFNNCENNILDYMSLKNPTKDELKRLIDRIEIDKDKKIYVYLTFPSLINNQLS